MTLAVIKVLVSVTLMTWVEKQLSYLLLVLRRMAVDQDVAIMMPNVALGTNEFISLDGEC